MKKTFLPILLLALLLNQPAWSQRGVNYNDVAVVMNVNSIESQTIADYFVQKRNIPAGNIIPVSVTTDEEVNDSTFRDYADQIKSYLIAYDLQDTINYIVTTKGCPLKVARPNVDCNASAESELMLMTVSYESYIGDCASNSDIVNGRYIDNPYYNSVDSFFKQGYQIYLVTRLDGYTVPEVLDIIDHSGPNTYVNKDSVLFVLDQSPNWSNHPLTYAMARIADTLTLRGWNVLLNKDSVYVTNQQNVLGYVSYGSNDGYSQNYTTNAIPHNTWARGAIAETHVSTSARSFTTGTPYGQSLIADWIHEGISGVKGYVYEPYTIAIAVSSILFHRYTDLRPDGTPKYNLAQSYFAASKMIGWMDVVVGDPKTSITTNPDFSNSLPEITELPVRLFPNPASSELFVTGKNVQVDEINIYNTAGQWLAGMKQPGTNSLHVGALAPGLYIAEIKAGAQSRRVRWVKQ